MNRQEKYNELINAKQIVKISSETSKLPEYRISDRLEVTNGIILCEKQIKRNDPNETSVIVVDFSTPTNVKIYKGTWKKNTVPNLVRTTKQFNGYINNRDYYMYRDGFSRQELVLLPYLYFRAGRARQVRAWGNERTKQSTPQTGNTPQTQEVNYQINHIDMNKSTYDITKLELVTKQENRKHAVLVAELHSWAEKLGFNITFSFIGLSATNISAIRQGALEQFCKSYDTGDKTYYINYLVEHKIIRPLPLVA